MCKASTVSRASSQLGFQSDRRGQLRNTHGAPGASVQTRTRQAQKHSKSKQILFYDDQGRLLSLPSHSLPPSLPLSLHICSLIYLKRYLSTMRRPPFHAPDPSRIRASPAIDVWPSSWAAGTQITQPPPEPCSPSRIPLNLPPWCWAKPCCFLPPF